jgi:hypothetical protein
MFSKEELLGERGVAHTGPKVNTNKTQTQADLRGSPKPGTSTEAADCILMEE